MTFPTTKTSPNNENSLPLATLKAWGRECGLADVGITAPQIAAPQHAKALATWLEQDHCGTMEFMRKNQAMRTEPRQLMPEVHSIICCRIDYPQATHSAGDTSAPQNPHFVPYSLVRDYHKIMNQCLKKLAQRVENYAIKEHAAKSNIPSKFYCRIFCDTAPILEKSLAAQAGLGWIGKNSLLINKQSGSRCFLGEIFTNLPLDFFVGAEQARTMEATDGVAAIKSNCGSCQRCIDACPTKALHAPHALDARRCIAYLTIEHRGTIAAELEPLIGAQVFGCDICQRCCPWNSAKERAAMLEKEEVPTTMAAAAWQQKTLAELAVWDEATYLQRTAGTPLRRLGFARWQRNLALARRAELHPSN